LTLLLRRLRIEKKRDYGFKDHIGQESTPEADVEQIIVAMSL